MVHFDHLSDAGQSLIFLIDCTVADDEIVCGLACFRGGLRGLHYVVNGGDRFRIAVPPEAGESRTWLNICSQKRQYKVKRVN